MATNIFSDPSKSIPKRDEQIVRVDFSKQDMGRPPTTPTRSPQTAIQHVPNAGSKT